MSQTALAFMVFGVLCAGVLVMFWMERRAVAKRKADGTYVDVSDILFFGSKAVVERDTQALLAAAVGRALGSGVARLDHGLQGRAFVARIALHRLNEIGDEIVPLAQLRVDIGLALLDHLAKSDKPVVNPDH